MKNKIGKGNYKSYEKEKSTRKKLRTAMTMGAVPVIHTYPSQFD